MTINFKQPKYVIPLLALPFLALFFYVYQSSSRPKAVAGKPRAGINSAVGDVSDDVKKEMLSDKLDAYRNIYKEADGNTAVSPVPVEDTYTVQQKKMLDSIHSAIKPGSDRTMIAALNHVRQKNPDPPGTGLKDKDPMDLFRQQMAIMDSLQKAADPEAKAAAKKKALADKLAQQQAGEHNLAVRLAVPADQDFNTVRPETQQPPIQAVIDENVTGYAGSRIRLRLLADIEAGSNTIKKGTYLYALVSGFAQQRVTLEIRTIFYQGRILPVKLDLYDTDGLPGLYVPESAFRDFTKDLGTNTIQGVSMDGSSGFVMSAASKIFESTSGAIAGMIRKNKARLKYNSYIYLIDNSKL